MKILKQIGYAFLALALVAVLCLGVAFSVADYSLLYDILGWISVVVSFYFILVVSEKAHWI